MVFWGGVDQTLSNLNEVLSLVLMRLTRSLGSFQCVHYRLYTVTSNEKNKKKKALQEGR